MHLGPITFCNGTGFSLRTGEDKGRILADLQAAMGMHSDQQLKAFMDRSKFHERFEHAGSQRALQSSPHLISACTHGSPMYLFLTTIDGVPQCVFIDARVRPGFREPRMVLRKLYFDRALFKGTVLEGELVHTETGAWTFLITDVLADGGVGCSMTPLVQRLNRAYEILSKGYTADKMDPCKLEVKRYLPSECMQELLEFIPRLPYATRGILFKPLTSWVGAKGRSSVIFAEWPPRPVPGPNPTGTPAHPKEPGHAKMVRKASPLPAFTKNARGGLYEHGRRPSKMMRVPCPSGTHASRKSPMHASLKSPVHASLTTASSGHMSTSTSSGHMSSSRSSSSGDRTLDAVIGNACLDDEAQAPPMDQHGQHTVTFNVRRTHLPDVYELICRAISPTCIPTMGSKRMIACIPTMNLSREMCKLFASVGVTESIPMRCKFHAKFQKWVPLVPDIHA